MKTIMYSLAILMFLPALVIAQVSNTNVIQKDTVSKIKPYVEVADQIKKERNMQQQLIDEQSKAIDEAIEKIKSDLKETVDVKSRVSKIEALNGAQETRLSLLENSRNAKIKSNGQLAFTELLSIQRDIQPAKLFSASTAFFTQLGSVSDLQNYSDFSDWKKEYDIWYQKKKGPNQLLELINNSVKLVSDISNKVPLYGSVVQTVSSGITTILDNVGGANKKLIDLTPKMLIILNTLSQFAGQKAIIDNEWTSINGELDGLQKENAALVQDQITYYGLDRIDFEEKYMKETLDYKRDNYKNAIRQVIVAKMVELNNSPKTKEIWMGQVEIYMYRVQSLRLRFGQLTMRMFTNIDRYNDLIELFSDDKKFTNQPQVTVPIGKLGKSLKAVHDTFAEYFSPAKYIEESATMYIQ